MQQIGDEKYALNRRRLWLLPSVILEALPNAEVRVNMHFLIDSIVGILLSVQEYSMQT